jgi:glutamate N-acetyltransferase/amino-acid N-acetyltransferase
VTVTSPQGFRAAGVAAGLKSSGNPDVALVVNDGPEDAAAAVFTTNRFPAAPVLWSRQVLATQRLKAVVLNSGGANACTGPEGFGDTHATAEHVAAELGIGAGEVAVASTGLIGVRLPMDALLPGVTAAVSKLSADGGTAAAQAIMTTDSVPKTTVQRGEGWTVGGIAKGAGMLAPSLATMLVVLTRRWPRRSCCRPHWRRPPASASSGSTPTAACPPTTPSSPWPTAPAASRPRPRRSPRR